MNEVRRRRRRGVCNLQMPFVFIIKLSSMTPLKAVRNKTDDTSEFLIVLLRKMTSPAFRLIIGASVTLFVIFSK